MGVEAASASEERSEHHSPPGRMAVAPSLVRYYKTQEQIKIHSLYNIFEPNNENCRDNIPEFSGTTFYQKPCHQGWLIILCDNELHDYTSSTWNFGDCFLWNPVKNERIQLPTLLQFCGDDYRHIYDCVLSSPPRTTDINLDKNSNDWMVLLVLLNGHHEEPGYTFLFCRPGETQWRSEKLSQDIVGLIPYQPSISVLCFKGKLYLMCTYDNKIDEHHLEIEPFTTNTDLTISIKPFHVKKEVLFPEIGKAHPRSRYVETHDELFRVDLIQSRHTSEVFSIEVVRLNFSLMEWEKVVDFGDHVLFVSSNHTTACCSAAELGFKRGCLYYLHRKDEGLIHKFEIESTGHTIILPYLSPTEEFSYTDWVTMHGRVENMLGGKVEENVGLTVTEIKTETTTTAVVNDENQGGNCNSGEVKAPSYWNNLIEEIVELIANLLHGSDYKHFRSVCKRYREILPKVQKTSYLSPWLLFSRDQSDTIFNVVNPMYNDESYSINLPDLPDYTIRFQKDGWLLMTRDHNIVFYNPLTQEKVKLPDMDRVSCYSVVSFSSLPTCSDCIVFSMDDRGDGFYIDFVRRGEEHWSSLIFHHNGIYPSFVDTAVFHDGDFFCVDIYYGTVGVFSAKDNTWKVLEKPHELDFGGIAPSFLVKCGEDLLILRVEEYHRKPIRIFRLNFSEMKWEEVKSLGEHVLFISHTSCTSAVAPDSHMKNKIYFPRLYLDKGGIVVYSPETHSYHSRGSEHVANSLSGSEGWFRNCTWIQPNMSMSTTEELDWVKPPA